MALDAVAAQLARVVEIATILSASGFGWLVQALGLRTCVSAGQMLALRPDYVPLEYAEALRGLHTHAAPFPAAEAVAIVEAEPQDK